MQKIINIKQGVTRMPTWRMSKPVDFQLCDGEHIAIVGPNGGGKSLFVDMITGAHPLLMNSPEYDFSPSSKKLASDIIQYISFRDFYGTQQSMLDKYVVLMSSGETRKFQLTRTLLRDPRVLILDNPFIGLDAETRNQLKELLSILSKERALQIILVLSKTDDIPEFITHVVEVKDRVVGKKLSITDYNARCRPYPDHALSKDKKEAILALQYNSQEFHTEYVVKMNGVSIRYGNRTILDSLNWNVKNGERWALSGQNGSGKSTLLSLVCADNPQSYACDIELFGVPRGSGETIWDIKKHIGYVSPEMHRAYLRDLPAIRIVASGLKDSVGLYVKPTEKEYEICRFWMDVFGLRGQEERTFLKLSSGEQRLVLLARAFVKDPELLILDEPLHGLDNTNRILVKDVIETFCQRKNKTLIMVTHYAEELPECITNKIILKRQV